MKSLQCWCMWKKTSALYWVTLWWTGVDKSSNNMNHMVSPTKWRGQLKGGGDGWARNCHPSPTPPQQHIKNGADFRPHPSAAGQSFSLGSSWVISDLENIALMSKLWLEHITGHWIHGGINVSMDTLCIIDACLYSFIYYVICFTMMQHSQNLTLLTTTAAMWVSTISFGGSYRWPRARTNPWSKHFHSFQVSFSFSFNVFICGCHRVLSRKSKKIFPEDKFAAHDRVHSGSNKAVVNPLF